jgi:asparagine synthase (glutamine-hydrolysing)
MPADPLLAGIYDPRRTLGAQRARQLVEQSLAFMGPVRVVQSGPLTAGLAPAAAAPAEAAPGGLMALLEGSPRANGVGVGAAEVATRWALDGEAGLAVLRGGFLVLLWDEQQQRGMLARDQIGQRPLLWHGADRLSFAGDFRALLGLLDPRPAPDEATVACWLRLSVPSDGHTFFERVRRLPPGHLIELADSRWKPRMYWAPRYQEPLTGTREELLHGLRTEIERATATALDGVSAAGILLSGGVDSSTVAAVAAPLARDAGVRLRAYSAGFPGLVTADESSLIDDVLAAARLEGTRMSVYGGSLLAGTLRYTEAWGMPDLSANNFFWIDLLSRASEEGVEALLDGEGGDEVFNTAYYLLADRLRGGRVKALRELLENWPMIAGNPSRRLRAKILGIYAVGGNVPHFAHRMWWRHRPSLSTLELTERAERLAVRAADPSDWKRLDGPRWWAHLADGTVYGPDRIGSAEHALRLARMAGVERRRPLLDLDLSEHVLRLPPELAFTPWFGKGHVREAMEGLVPDSVRLRRQKTFFTDVRVRSLIESDLPFARRLLGPDAEVRRYVSAQSISDALEGPGVDAAQSTRGLWGFRLQHLASTEIWLRAQADPEFPGRLRAEAGLDAARYTFEPQGSE